MQRTHTEKWKQKHKPFVLLRFIELIVFMLLKCVFRCVSCLRCAIVLFVSVRCVCAFYAGIASDRFFFFVFWRAVWRCNKNKKRKFKRERTSIHLHTLINWCYIVKVTRPKCSAARALPAIPSHHPTRYHRTRIFSGLLLLCKPIKTK